LSAAETGAPIIISKAIVPTAAPRDQFVMFMVMSFASRNASEGGTGRRDNDWPLGPPSGKRSAYYGRESNGASAPEEHAAHGRTLKTHSSARRCRRRRLWSRGRNGGFVSAENWHDERDRLVRLLKAIESGEVTHVDEEDMRQLQATTPENIETLKQRLAELNDRLSGGG